MKTAKFTALFLIAFLVGFVVGEVSAWRNVNQMLTVGFTVTDPDGFEVERFAEFPVLERFAYWTTQEK